MWLLHKSYVTFKGINESPECPARFGTHVDEPQVELRGVNNKQDAKHPDDKSVAMIYSFRSVFMRLLECHDLAKGHRVRGAVHSSGK